MVFNIKKWVILAVALILQLEADSPLPNPTCPAIEMDQQSKLLLEKLHHSALNMSLYSAGSDNPTLSIKTASQVSISRIENLTIKGSIGPIPLRIYIPEGEGPFPVHYSIHGGGWIVGDITTHDSFCRAISKKANCIVVSVDYHRGPSHPFPKPLEDCYTALEWIIKNIGTYGGNSKLLSIGGPDTGGNLAAATTLMARDRLLTPSLICQVLIYPVTNYNFDTLSYYQYESGYLLTRGEMRWLWLMYLRGADGKHPYASPLQGISAQLPPALIITANFDPLRDDGLAYAYQLRSLGVPVMAYNYPTLHAFMDFQQLLDVGQEALDTIASYLKEQSQSKNFTLYKDKQE